MNIDVINLSREVVGKHHLWRRYRGIAGMSIFVDIYVYIYIMNVHKLIFVSLTTVSVVAYVLLIAGASIVDPTKIGYINIVFQVYVSLFIMYRFNPFRKSYRVTRFDAKIIFAAATFLLTTTFMNNLIPKMLTSGMQENVSLVGHSILGTLNMSRI
jgi:hypothetical protein